MAKYTHKQAIGRAAAYYRANPHRFVKDFLHIDLRWFQKIVIYAMNMNPAFCMIASRGLGKSFLIAIYCCVRCVLYPGTKICIASGTRGQATNVLEKIRTEIIPKSNELKCELRGGDIKIAASEAIALFKNGSYIKVVTASDSARGNRANVLVLDEFRMIDKDTIDTVLTKFLTASRQPGYLSKPEYAHLKDQERNRQVYLSSAYFQDHWSYMKVKSFVKNMQHPDRDWFICSFPYQLAIKEKLSNREDIADQMLDEDFNEIRWMMEMLAEFYGDSEGSFFNYEAVAKNRKIQYPMLPGRMCAKLANNTKLRIQPKTAGEKRILSVDIALMSSNKHKNDASAIFINQLLPTKASRYINNIIYTETSEGLRTEEQALQIRRLYEEYECDYIVIDCKGVGLGVYDALASDISDVESGEIYPALSCCNNPDMAARCTSRNAEKVIWAINGAARFNSDCAVMLREGFKSGKIRLLATEYDGEKALASIKGYNNLHLSDQTELTLPYVNTTLLINELINLQYEDSNGLIKITEKSGMRKDRYSSLSYNYWVACQLEKNIRKRSSSADSVKDVFMFRAPKIK
ncbi:MAG: terminase family protein [Alistipes sp.]|nr:terminase family protein [Alistipes sp.]